MTASQAALPDLLIAACAEAWRGAGEIIATGIGPIPRLGAALAKSSFSPDLLMSDGEAWYTTAPVPPGPRGAEPEREGIANYDRVFATLWRGKRHAMVTPVQLDRFGQANISAIGDPARPKAAMLGARGFPGNSICHPNSFFLPAHNKRALVAGEVDFVCSAGYNKRRYLGGRPPAGLDLRIIVTDLCVMDFGGPDHAIRVRSLHPGVTFEEVADNTGFALARPAGECGQTPAPTPEQLGWIAALDPNGVRHGVLRGK